MIIFIRSTFNLTSTTFHSYIDVIADAKWHWQYSRVQGGQHEHSRSGDGRCRMRQIHRAEAIHERLGYVYAEGDDFHPQANIDKMSAGIPLTDEDRWPWLKVINTWMVAREALDENTVVSSSA